MCLDTLACFVQGNLGWAYMQQNNFLSAEAVYRSVCRFQYAPLGRSLLAYQQKDQLYRASVHMQQET